MNGITARLSRISKDGKFLIIPMDHGVTVGPLKGLYDIEKTVAEISEGATAVLLHKGIIRSLKTVPDIGIIMHLSASTILGIETNWKVTVGSVEEAIRLGVDAISVHINLGNSREPLMLEYLGEISEKCNQWQIPLISMIYPRGENIKDPYDPEILSHVVRLGAELGSDVIKTNYTGDPNTFEKVVESTSRPVVIAGGPKTETEEEFFQMVKGAVDSGAAGAAIGRNVFTRNEPSSMVKAISSIIFEDLTINEALEIIKD
ncbi:MAG: fructose-bisphosphate aldolase [Candidatus Lokiarchaeota archaeon]|nr:fructose-bisphosphate aldolase [Candidatus Lokiarchaeota archaeon]